jgi:hypothetical protein
LPEGAAVEMGPLDGLSEGSTLLVGEGELEGGPLGSKLVVGEGELEGGPLGLELKLGGFDGTPEGWTLLEGELDAMPLV